MTTPKKATLPISVTHYSDLDLSSQHITTSNFMQFDCAKAMELVPKQSIDINMTTFARLLPMPVPTFGNADVHTRAYFVPFRTVMRGWNEFIEDTTYINGYGVSYIPQVPTIANNTFKQLFTLAEYATNVGAADITDEDGNPAYDLVWYSGNAPLYKKLTPLGKYAFKLLHSLGYRPYFGNDNGSLVSSALPFLCFMKVYFDWYFPTAYVDDERANRIRRWLNYESSSATNTFQSQFTYYEVSNAIKEMYRVAYDSDYFVSAWDNPVAPNSDAYSPITLRDCTTTDQINSITSATDNGTPVVDGVITQFAVDALKAINDYTKKHQLAGARVLDRYLTRWGIKLPDAALTRSQFIGESLSKVQFGDVTSTSDTSGAQLGAYAGKGFALNNANGLVRYSCDEFGMLIIVSSIVPKTAYYQGRDRMVSHISKLDFYTPEFDNLGVQALATSELYVPQGELTSENDRAINFDDAVFGFVPRYAEYKRGRDALTGDYALFSQKASNQGWTLMRDVSPFFAEEAYVDVSHSQNFVDGTDADQYNRIFYITDNVEDKFNIVHNFVIKSRFPGKSLYDSYEFKDYDKAQKVTVDINGVRAN